MRFPRPAERPPGLPRHAGDRRPTMLDSTHPGPSITAPRSPHQEQSCASTTVREPMTEAPRHRKKRGPAYKISTRSHPSASARSRTPIQPDARPSDSRRAHTRGDGAGEARTPTAMEPADRSFPVVPSPIAGVFARIKDDSARQRGTDARWRSCGPWAY